MGKFKLKSSYLPTGDQPQSIEKLTAGVRANLAHQVLLGTTGSGKTFTMCNVIEKLQMPTLVISHNKTLAAQLYQEFRDFFPENAVSYFVSYYDYYQPEAYIPSTDTYIAKETDINQEIDKLRLSATTNLLTRKDTIVVASVSAIYNLGNPKEYGVFTMELAKGMKVNRDQLLIRLTELQYERSEFGFHRGTFRVRGETLDVFLAYDDKALRIQMSGDRIGRMMMIDPVSGEVESDASDLINYVIYPAKHYIADTRNKETVFNQIKRDLDMRVKELAKAGKEFEAHRLEQRVNYDLEMMAEIGYVNGIENYSRYFDGRAPGDPPYTLLEYFNEPYGDEWLLVIDESHMTVPQIRGMFNGDRSRKQTLIDFGFRLPSALDNRPLTFDEFQRRVKRTIYTSATPDEWETKMANGEWHIRTCFTEPCSRCRSNSKWKMAKGKRKKRLEKVVTGGVVEQLIRPTGLVDPDIEVRPTKGQVNDLTREIRLRTEKGERVLVTTLTKRMAEELAEFLAEQGVKVHYLHSEIQTLDRSDILDDLRGGKVDVLVGINLLREGLDLPEVSLVAILDADKEGFLRSRTALIQTMGRAARHISGKVIMYADEATNSMKAAIDEVRRRREIQLEYNKEHGITPKSIVKPIREKLIDREKQLAEDVEMRPILADMGVESMDEMTPYDRKKLVARLKIEMNIAAKELRFEEAAILRDRIKEIQSIK